MAKGGGGGGRGGRAGGGGGGLSLSGSNFYAFTRSDAARALPVGTTLTFRSAGREQTYKVLGYSKIGQGWTPRVQTTKPDGSKLFPLSKPTLLYSVGKAWSTNQTRVYVNRPA